ncbi:MAG: hypothetical protein H0T42_31790 [Deltaproteobacteria bacterium]|nr:hypothetical protein [Deltaproteobacteria bacterium]
MAFVRLTALTALSLVASPVAAAPRGECRVVELAFQPMQRMDLSPGVNPPPQIVAWVEDRNGVYVDTVFITQETGTYGLGNRPGRFDLNSGPLWPYGRRITTFPVWAHKHGLEFPELVFQSGEDTNLSHQAGESSRETYYCRPMQRLEPAWDALTCASPGFVGTDKGKLDPTKRSKYPPRQDVTRVPSVDSVDVDRFGDLNPFDTVSQATPMTGVVADISWPLPEDLPAGDYVMWVEVAKEFDHNATYSADAYPAPSGIPWTEYGVAYRGQPSVLYRVPFTVGATETVASTTDYIGYGDPDGLDGNVRAPDATISSTVVGSGALRFAIVPDAASMYRVRVTARPEPDVENPSSPTEIAVVDTTNTTATFTFFASGDDGTIGKVKGYEIRYRAQELVTEANFDEPGSIDPHLTLPIGEPGEAQTFTLAGLLPTTQYSVAIRALDDCRNVSALTVFEFTTPERKFGEVDACFIATAAYGSPLAADVQMLRGVRDSVLRKTVLGELAVEAYYTFGPAAAAVIGESELLRATARELIAPIVRYARSLRR